MSKRQISAEEYARYNIKPYPTLLWGGDMVDCSVHPPKRWEKAKLIDLPHKTRNSK